MMPEKGIHVHLTSITYVYLKVGNIPPVLIQHHEQSALCICAYVCAYVCCVCVWCVRVCMCVSLFEQAFLCIPASQKGKYVCVCVFEPACVCT
jgi:hypothetical protein